MLFSSTWYNLELGALSTQPGAWPVKQAGATSARDPGIGICGPGSGARHPRSLVHHFFFGSRLSRTDPGRAEEPISRRTVANRSLASLASSSSD
jgi:hypothetical protein